jgi:hypothetical protein
MIRECLADSHASIECDFFEAPKLIGTPVIVPSQQGLSSAEVEWSVMAFRFGFYIQNQCRPSGKKT